MWVCTHFWLENGSGRSLWKARQVPCRAGTLSFLLFSPQPHVPLVCLPALGHRAPSTRLLPSLGGRVPAIQRQPLGYLWDRGTCGWGRRAGSWVYPVHQCSVFAISAKPRVLLDSSWSLFTDKLNCPKPHQSGMWTIKVFRFPARTHRFCTSVLLLCLQWLCRSIGMKVGHNFDVKSFIILLSRSFIKLVQILE